MISRLSEHPPIPGFLVGLIFVVVSILFVCGLQIGLGLFAVAVTVAFGHKPDDLAWLIVDPFAIGLASLLQNGGLVVLAFAVVWLMRRDVRESFALTGCRVGALAAALLVGLSAGLFAGWVAETAMTLFEGTSLMDAAHFEMITDAMLSDQLVKRWFFIGVVVLAAPVFEELIFRGLLWNTFEESTGPWRALLITSLLFAGYHVVPIHVVSVFSTGVFLGLLRLLSGSIWPSMFAHFINNALSVALVLWLGEESSDFETTVWMGAVGLAASVAGVGLAYALGRPRLLPSQVPSLDEDADGIE
jgi:membrane protease YdiL (CAAX protease family)